MGRLFEAAERGDVQHVRSLLAEGISPDEFESGGSPDYIYKGSYPLHIAVHFGHVEVVKILLEHGADPTARDKFGKCPIDYSQNPEIYFALSNHPKQMQLSKMRRELAATADKGDLVGLKSILDQGVNPNDLWECYASLHRAVSHGFRDIVLELIRRGSDVNVQDINKATPLHNASRTNNIEVARILLDAGANVNATNIGGTPLINAAQSGHLEMVTLLLSYGADLKPVEQFSWWGALTYACSKGHLSIVRVLLEHGAEINARDSNNATALHHAAFGGHVEVVRLLLEKGALNIRDKNGETPSDYVRARKLTNWKEVIDVLETRLAAAEEREKALAATKKLTTTSDRVVVSECVNCHRLLRVKAHAVRPQMTLTCKCGHQNKVSTDGFRSSDQDHR